MVSVVVPSYNHSKYLKQRIDSVLSQTYTDFELIILDDCSPDDSRDVIEKYRKILAKELEGREEGYSDGINLIAGKEARECLSHILDN